MTRGNPERCGRCDARQQSEIAKPLCISMAVYLCNLRIDKQQIIPAFSRIHTGAAFAYTHRRPAKRVPAAPIIAILATIGCIVIKIAIAFRLLDLIG